MKRLAQGKIWDRVILSVAAASLFGGVAQAQDRADSDDDEIIVTAQRRAQNVRDVPLSIDVVEEEQIINQGIEDVQRLAESVTSLVVGGQGQTFGGLNLTIRGVGSNSGDPAVGYYIDEVYIANPGGFVSQFIDVDRVEVLNGPQGTLFGRNTTGGVVHFITQQPGREFSARAYGEIGWYDSLDFDAVPIWRIGGAINVPLGESLSVRASIARVHQDNYIFNLERAEPEPNQDATTFRGAVSIHPGSRFELILNVDYINDPRHNSFLFKNRATPGTSVFFINNLLSDVGPEDSPFRVRSNLSPVADYEELGLRAKLTYDFTDALQFRSITAYRELELDRAADLDVTQATIVHNTSQQDDQTFSQELQLYYETDRFNILGGLYYFDREFQQNAQTFASTPFFLLTSCNSVNPPLPSIAAFCPLINQVSTVFIPLIAGRPPQLSDFLPGGLFTTLTGISAATTVATTQVFRTFDVESYAAFAQANFRLTDQISITAGARYTSDKKNVTALTQVSGVGTPVTLDETFNAFTPKLGVEFRPNANTLAYASITRGFKSGDLNLFANAVAGEDPRVDPERIWAYEAGFRTALADGRLLLDASAFYYDYSNYQLNVQFAEGPRIFNLDKVEIYGFEFQPVFRPTRGLRLGGSITYLHSEVRRSSRNFIDPFNVPAGPINPVGLRLPQSPEWKANAFVSYTQPISSGSDLTFAAEVTHSGRFNNDLFGSFPNESYTVVNGNIRLRVLENRLSLNVYARNIFNEVYTTSSLFADSIGELQFFAPPRTVGVQLSFTY